MRGVYVPGLSPLLLPALLGAKCYGTGRIAGTVFEFSFVSKYGMKMNIVSVVLHHHFQGDDSCAQGACHLSFVLSFGRTLPGR